MSDSEAAVISKEEQAKRRANTEAMIQSIIDLPRPGKWQTARDIWISLAPINAKAHNEACEEVKEIRAGLIDKKYGRTKAALGLDPNQRSNGKTKLRMVAIFPAPLEKYSLKDWLKRVDPEFLQEPRGTEYRLNWRQVYKAFPEYTIPEEVDDYYEGVDKPEGDPKK